MRAVVLEAPGEISVATVPDPTPASDDVVIAVDGCGLCGTDLHLVEGELPATQYPLIPGHEFYGQVVATGSDVGAIKVGDWVAVDPNLPCGHCRYCGADRSNLCESYQALGVTTAGACAEFVAAPQRTCHVLPDDYPLGSASLIEPLSCVIHGFDRLPNNGDETFLIYGAGTIGLLLASLATDRAAGPPVLVDTNPAKCERARSLGFQSVESADVLDVPDWSVVIDATGAPAAIGDGLSRVATGGTVLLFGVASPDATVALHPYDVYRREVTILGSMAVLNSFGRAIPALASRHALAEQLISHEFGLADYSSALATFRSGESMKVVMRPSR